MATESKDDDRLFVRDGFRHYRRTYSLAEVRWGLAVAATLAAVAAWVIWKGAHPDPALFSDGANLLDQAPSAATASVAVAAGPAAPPSAGKGETAGGESAGAPIAAGDRGPLPANLAGSGWKEDKIASYDEENLYVKINGRADYFRAFDFRRMTSVLLVRDGDPATTIDLEMYDLRRPPNALGAYGGERPQNAKVEATAGGLHHFDRNALFMARGPYYIRVIGSDETPVVMDKLRALATQLIDDVEAAPLPWAYGVVVGQLGLGADRLTYFAKNAFSLAFADDVWSMRPRGKDNDLELYISARKSPSEARTLAGKLEKAFLELGQKAGKRGGMNLVKDQFLGLYSGASHDDRFLIGVRGAESPEVAGAEVEKLRAALRAAPAEVRERAAPMPASDEAVPEKSAGADQAPAAPKAATVEEK